MVEILVRSDDVRLMPELEEFARLITEEYGKMRKGLRMRVLGLTGRVPDFLPCVVRKHGDGAVLDVPVDIPELEMLREAVKRYTGRDLGSPKYKKTMCDNLVGYLTKKKVSFDTVEVVGCRP